MSIGHEMIQALKAKYEADYKEAEVTVKVYCNNPVGIGEHPQHIEEMDKLVEKMASAKDKLEIINRLENNGQLIQG